VTDAKLIGGRASPFEDEGDSGTGKADALTRYMRSGADLLNLIPDSLVEPAEGKVLSSHSGDLMEKVALALDAENSLAEKAKREPDAHRALKKAGVSAAMYLQLATHPDFQAVCHRVYVAFVALPRWGAVCRSMSKAAMAGDVAAARFVRDLIQHGDKDMEEVMRRVERDGPASLKKEVAEIQLALHDLQSNMEEAERPEDLVAEATADVATQHLRAEPEVRLDLNAWTEGQ